MALKLIFQVIESIPFGQERNWKNVSEHAHRLTENAAEMLSDKIKEAYREVRSPENHPFTKIVDTHDRGGISGYPLAKTHQLINAVEHHKVSRGHFHVRIKPTAKTEDGHGQRQTLLSEIAIYQETGYSIPVTERVRRFWSRMKTISKDERIFVPQIGTLLHVPARPVWEPTIEKALPWMRSAYQNSIRHYLFLKGRHRSTHMRVRTTREMPSVMDLF